MYILQNCLRLNCIDVMLQYNIANSECMSPATLVKGFVVNLINKLLIVAIYFWVKERTWYCVVYILKIPFIHDIMALTCVMHTSFTVMSCVARETVTCVRPHTINTDTVSIARGPDTVVYL